MAITIVLLPGNVDGRASNFIYGMGTLAFSGNYIPAQGTALNY
ncbi:MAG TPA: hypothetical protein VL128_07815 [Candidatus Eisenbacteria bacterium]|nr:hypothetical protein [Candidatus Eisenbacteria bacterium]